MASGIAAGALGSSGLLGAAAPLTVERPRSGGKPDGQLTFVYHYGTDVPVWLVCADSGLVAGLRDRGPGPREPGAQEPLSAGPLAQGRSGPGPVATSL